MAPMTAMSNKVALNKVVHRTIPRPPVVGAVVALLLVLTGCQQAIDTAVGTAETAQRIQEETGSFDINVDTGLDVTTIDVRYGTDETEEAAVRAEAERVAQVVWDTLPLEIERVVVQPRGAPADVGAVTYERAELAERFGPRDPELDQSLGEVVWPFALLPLIALLLVIAVVVAIVVAANRRNRPPAPERQRRA